MHNWKHPLAGAACALALTALLLPARALAQAPDLPSAPQTQETQPPFQNPDGITLDLVFYEKAEDGSDKEIKKVDRAIIPAGTASITVEMQKQLLPEGYQLKEPADIPLTEDMLEVKILIEPVKETPPTEPSEKPTEPSEKPTEPSEKPTEPAEKPTEPSEKPTEPSEKPTEPAEKPTKPAEKPSEKPAEKPNKPNKPAGKPDTTNPQTGDSFAIWPFLGLSSAGALLLIALNKFRRARK